MKTQLFIDGDWRFASDGGTFVVEDPANEEVVAEVSSASSDDVTDAIESARKAGKTWGATAPRERAEILRKTFEIFSSRSAEVADLIVRENGKTITDARAEVSYANEFFRWYSEEAVRNRGEIANSPGGDKRIIVYHQPIGVALLVTPWNFPAAMATRKIAPALAAGCTVILKPASDTPLTALLVAEILTDAGVPPGVVNVVPTRQSAAAVQTILGHPAVRKLSFTGSTAVGRQLLKEASNRIIKCSMELGGNAPFVVFDDADMQQALEGVMLAKMRNGGESCAAANRIFVHRKIYEEFSQRFVTSMQAIKVGSGFDNSVGCGPMINDAAITEIDRLVGDAVSRGAEVLTGGSRINGIGHYYRPTVLGQVPKDSDILRQEVFGPVAPLLQFEDEDEVVELANDTEHGLVSYVFTRDLARGLRVSERLEAGMIGLNIGLVSDTAAPFGGVKQSGIGREGSHEGMMEYMEAKYVATNW